MTTVSTAPPSTGNYVIPKGILYVAEWSGTTPPAENAFADFGNVSSVEIEPTLEKQPHFSSRGGFRKKDKDPVIQIEYKVTFEADEIALQNLNRLFMGTRTHNVIKAMTATDREYALKFVTDNPIGPNYVYRFHRCSLAPNGAMGLISEEYQKLPFIAEGLADETNHADSPYFTITGVTTTTTTTTA